MAPRRGEEARPRPPARNLGSAGDRVLKSTSASPSPSSKPKRRPGRPFKLPRSNSSHSSRSGLSASPSVGPPVVRRRALSILETLPVEIIEKIFLFSLNLELPRASPVLAAALSREQVYNLLIILAFWDDPMITDPLSAEMAAMLAPLEYEPLGWEKRNNLQTAIFRCRWCTMARVRDQIPKILNLTLHRLWINTGIEMEPEQRAALDRFMKREDITTLVFKGKGGTQDRLEERIKSPSSKSHRFLQNEGPHEYGLEVQPNVCIRIHSPTVVGGITWPAIELREFPLRLLRGSNTGFAAEDVAFLEVLRLCSHNFYDGSHEPNYSATRLNRTALHQGVKNAIRTENLEALVSLLKIDEYMYNFGPRTQDPDTAEVYLPYTIPSDHFVTVTRMGHSNPRLNLACFEALVRANAESIPTHSPEITQWTIENIHLAEQNPRMYRETNGNFARWLSDFILRLPLYIKHGNGVSHTLFFLGKLDESGAEGRRYLEEVLQPRNERFLNYMAESSFNPAEFWLEPGDSTL